MKAAIARARNASGQLNRPGSRNRPPGLLSFGSGTAKLIPDPRFAAVRHEAPSRRAHDELADARRAHDELADARSYLLPHILAEEAGRLEHHDHDQDGEDHRLGPVLVEPIVHA